MRFNQLNLLHTRLAALPPPRLALVEDRPHYPEVVDRLFSSRYGVKHVVSSDFQANALYHQVINALDATPSAVIVSGIRTQSRLMDLPKAFKKVRLQTLGNPSYQPMGLYDLMIPWDAIWWMDPDFHTDVQLAHYLLALYPEMKTWEELEMFYGEH